MWLPIWSDYAKTGSIITWTAMPQKNGLMHKSRVPQATRSNRYSSDGE